MRPGRVAASEIAFQTCEIGRRVRPVGLPGEAFALILEELWTEIAPTGCYWNPTRVVSDNRIAAFASDASNYTFAAPTAGDASINVTLLFRRAYYGLVQWKSWDVPDIVMEESALSVPRPWTPD